MNGIDKADVAYVDTQHWRYEETEYVLGYMPTSCASCGDDIGAEEAGYIRDGPRANDGAGGMDELCFHCGQKVTGFGE